MKNWKMHITNQAHIKYQNGNRGHESKDKKRTQTNNINKKKAIPRKL